MLIFTSRFHWRIQGGAAGAPPMGSNSFIFAHVFAEKHPRRRLVPPPTGNPGSATGFALYYRVPV